MVKIDGFLAALSVRKGNLFAKSLDSQFSILLLCLCLIFWLFSSIPFRAAKTVQLRSLRYPAQSCIVKYQPSGLFWTWSQIGYQPIQHVEFV
ncbi:hypothetical protein L1987_54920 [Smallanthus sonchifolius]|uniref:Uncharacterized protein n=1 Tax=Smallanthus sonchifolius TaxID=185202 RepID=A0ACB9E8W2_9ASTR|nr:hypothetical protein L1987_54920 [Smallanthus sonchifolius]